MLKSELLAALRTGLHHHDFSHFVDEPPSRAQGGDLLRYGQAARYMADPKNNAGEPNPSFQVQLNEARLEWKRRHSCR
jgi:hypothetical protein